MKCVCQHRQRHPHNSMIACYVTTHRFCRGSKVKRNLLTIQSVKRYFPMLYRHGLPWGYYVDASNKKPVLGLLRVDTHLLQVNRIWQRSLDLLETHRRSPAFRRLIVGHQFVITWAVATNSKQDAIRYLASKKQQDIPFDAQHFPYLLAQPTETTIENNPRRCGFVIRLTAIRAAFWLNKSQKTTVAWQLPKDTPSLFWTGNKMLCPLFPHGAWEFLVRSRILDRAVIPVRISPLRGTSRNERSTTVALVS